jgi:hypothetical protein
MMQPLLLDALLILVIVLLVPIGVHRGGLREGCTAAGLLLGMHLVDEWAVTWGDWLSDATGIVPNVMTFFVAVLVLLLTTAFIGYGATAAFASSPGAGGRMYGAILAFLIGAVFLGSLITYVDRYLYEGATPRLVSEGYISRALSIGIGWVLLLAALVIVLTTLFGMIVRERDSDEFVMPIARAPVAAPSARITESPLATDAEKIEPPNPDRRKAVSEDVQRTAPIKIREVRHWEEQQSADTRPAGSGWNQTWPQTGRTVGQRAQREGHSRRSVRRPSGGTNVPSEAHTDQDDAAILRDWLANDSGPSKRDRDGSRPNRDE